MPTFASIELHPVLRSRLVVVAPTSSNNNAAHSATTTTTTRPLESPHSLLLHATDEWRLKPVDNGNNAATATTVAPHEAEAVRQKVAGDLHQATVCGKRQAHIFNQVQKQKQRRQQDGNNRTDNSPKVARIEGFLSVADLLQWRDALRRQPCLGTGDPNLDALAATTNDDTTTTAALMDSSVYIAKDDDDDDKNYEDNNVYHHAHNHHYSLQNNHKGIPWGTVVQLSGGPGVGKTQLALQMTAAAVQQDVVVHYLVPAHASRTALALRLAQFLVMNNHGDDDDDDDDDNNIVKAQQQALLSKVHFASFCDDVQLLMILAHLEAQWNKNDNDATSPPEDAPWLLVVDGWSPLTSHLQPWRWHRLVRLYHGIVLVVKSSSGSSHSSSSTSSSSSWGSIHWHVDGSGRLICCKHPQPNKVGTSLSFWSSETQDFDE